MVIVFYLFCRRTKRILVTAITGFKIYKLMQSLILFISENNSFFFEISIAHLYIYILIKIVICNGNLFSWSRFYSANIRYFWINLLHQISLQERLFSHLFSNIMTWQMHMVTHPQSTISFSDANHRTQTILQYSQKYNRFGKMNILRISKITSGSVYGVMSHFRGLMQQKL